MPADGEEAMGAIYLRCNAGGRCEFDGILATKEAGAWDVVSWMEVFDERS